MFKRSVLVVDDERLTRISLAAFLQDAGYQSVAVQDGESAIQLHQQQPFRVCIVDIRMPGMDGIETILALHQIAPDSYYIICTGSPQFVLPSILQEIGLSEKDVIQKPVLDMNIFCALIEWKLGGD
ncbi:MAG: response regulator [Anaerolineae bacterium]|nr:response regulator [Anaerolineae bacterium]